MNRLDDEQRQQLYAVAREKFAEFSADGRRRVMRAVRLDLRAKGWETILINIAIAYLVPLLLQWFRNRNTTEIGMTMPHDFATGNVVPLEDEGWKD